MALAFHLAAFIPPTALVLATGALASLTSSEVLVFAPLGGAGWLSYLAFYAALAIGADLASEPNRVGLFRGHRGPGGADRCGASVRHRGRGQAMLLTIAGLIVVSADWSRDRRPEDRSRLFVLNRARDRRADVCFIP